jgi:hypothetical protein
MEQEQMEERSLGLHAVEMEEGSPHSPGLHAVWMEQEQMEEGSPGLHAVWMEQKQMEKGSPGLTPPRPFVSVFSSRLARQAGFLFRKKNITELMSNAMVVFRTCAKNEKSRNTSSENKWKISRDCFPVSCHLRQFL